MYIDNARRINFFSRLQVS